MTNKLSGNRRYLALWFPYLNVDRLRICQPGLCAARPDAPIAFVEKVKGAMRLMAVDRIAQALGMAPGMTLADARARVPDLEIFEADPHADQDWLERLADGCIRYTPNAALDPPNGLMLDITGCAHLFGGEAGLADDVEARLTRLGMALRYSYASTPEAAHALARFQSAPAADEEAAVRRLPVAALRLEEESATAFVRAGLKTVGDVMRRPMATIAARFGDEAVTAIRRISGEADSPLAPRRALPALVLERRFAEPVARTEYALSVLAELAIEAAGALEIRKQGGRRFAATLFRADGLTRQLRIETGLPTRDPEAIMRLFNERLESLSDPVDPGFGFDMIRLAVPLMEPLAATQLNLEGGETANTETEALIDKLSIRLGRGQVRRFVPNDTHIPEQAQLALPATEAHAPAAWPVSEPGEPPLRPLHLFDPPQPIEVIKIAGETDTPLEGPPHRFRWRRAFHEVKRFEGPERIAAEWWRRKDGVTGDGGPTRDYYRVEDARGRRFWIFRHGLQQAEKAEPGWYMHGLFA